MPPSAMASVMPAKARPPHCTSSDEGTVENPDPVCAERTWNNPWRARAGTVR